LYFTPGAAPEGAHYTSYMASRCVIGFLRCVTLLFALAGLYSPASSAGSEWLEVPFVHQVKAGCGSAAIAMVMQYWASRQPGLDTAAADAERIDRVLPPESAKGIHGQALKRYLEE